VRVRVPFGEIAKRVAGFSTPFLGVSWNRPSSSATCLLGEFEDRCVVFTPERLAIPSHAVGSVREMRQMLKRSTPPKQPPD
jgi:hypothetical protein